jgi:hypothetical protein
MNSSGKTTIHRDGNIIAIVKRLVQQTLESVFCFVNHFYLTKLIKIISIPNIRYQ